MNHMHSRSKEGGWLIVSGGNFEPGGRACMRRLAFNRSAGQARQSSIFAARV